MFAFGKTSTNQHRPRDFICDLLYSIFFVSPDHLSISLKIIAGAFIGPVAAGVLMDAFGLSYATLFVVAFGVSVLAVSAVFRVVAVRKERRRKDMGYQEIEGVRD